MKSYYNIYDHTGQAWKAMYQAIFHAQKSIYWEVYILVDDDIGHTFFELLKEKAQAGVDVKLILDYWGSFALSKKTIDNFIDAGIDIRLFQQRRFAWRGIREWLMKRTHRKILVVDERVGFIGGVNVEKSTKNWHDIHIKLQGKVVRSLLRSFAKSYMVCGGMRKEVRHLLKYKYRVKHTEIDFIYDHYGRKYSKIRKRYVDALRKARERVILFSPYYFPDRQLFKAMWQARKRGVRIDVLIPFRTDLRLVTYAAYVWFSIMNKKGVHIHLLKKRMMHGKGVVMDDEWAMVGSSNIEHASFYHSQEASIKLQGKQGVKKIKRILERWIKQSEHFDEQKWKKRGKRHKVLEFIASKIYRLWFGIK